MTAPWRHHDCILGIKLCRQLSMGRAKAVRCPGILGSRTAKMRRHVVVLSIGGHIDGRIDRLLMMIAGYAGSASGCGQIRIGGGCRGAAAVVHLGAGSDGGHLQLNVVIVAAELRIITGRLLIRCRLQ